MDCNVIKIPSP